MKVILICCACLSISLACGKKTDDTPTDDDNTIAQVEGSSYGFCAFKKSQNYRRRSKNAKPSRYQMKRHKEYVRTIVDDDKHWAICSRVGMRIMSSLGFLT